MGVRINRNYQMKMASAPISHHMTGLFGLVVFSLIFYGVFAFFREQVCTLVCPYGRLQGVLLDGNSIVVLYDFVRGEPRSGAKVGHRDTKGDCINCRQCVKVCPTGIDIRNGTQLECINCTACIDACNTVMDSINKPRGLIRYTSFNQIDLGRKRFMTPRSVAYSIVLTGLILIIAFLFILRQPIEATILRTPGVLFQQQENGKISNLYNIKVFNKTYNAFNIELRLAAPAEGVIRTVSDLKVLGNDLNESIFFVDIHKNSLKSSTSRIVIEVLANGKPVSQINTTFLGPGMKP